MSHIDNFISKYVEASKLSSIPSYGEMNIIYNISRSHPNIANIRAFMSKLTSVLDEIIAYLRVRIDNESRIRKHTVHVDNDYKPTHQSYKSLPLPTCSFSKQICQMPNPHNVYMRMTSVRSQAISWQKRFG